MSATAPGFRRGRVKRRDKVALREAVTGRCRLREIVEEGVRCGQFAVDDPAVAAQSVFDATARFFHAPAYAAEWQSPAVTAEFTTVSDLLLRGLRA
ncbi:hypothetical protein [Streptomyces atratus]|uniref:Tetracyclin repressor-like C-terminal domain-containing protein n=1 Tax=Streptomyces atratus TaxID=1893 RepID=A0A2Z5JBS8_STRAR|nr:hypothetical protein [Streptomyces atratus]AXE77802.1 hypothetical protein C5746_13595 [Streptomyces atratus]